MILCYSEFRAYAHLSDECVSTKLGVTENHACFILVIFELYSALQSRVLSTFLQHLVQFPTIICIYIGM